MVDIPEPPKGSPAARALADAHAGHSCKCAFKACGHCRKFHRPDGSCTRCSACPGFL